MPGVASINSMEVESFDETERSISVKGTGTTIEGEPFEIDGLELR